MSAFLTMDDVAELTGRRVKTKQIEVLKKMGLPFFVNATGKPVVPVAAIEGKKAEQPKKTWEPKK